jgi:hypothetical protein
MRKRMIATIGAMAVAVGLAASPAVVTPAAPQSLTLSAFVVNQQCQGGDNVIVTLSATAESSSEVRGYKWDWTNNGRFDTGVLSSPQANHTYTDEINVTARIGAKNTEGNTAFDTVTFATLRCEG